MFPLSDEPEEARQANDADDSAHRSFNWRVDRAANQVHPDEETSSRKGRQRQEDAVIFPCKHADEVRNDEADKGEGADQGHSRSGL